MNNKTLFVNGYVCQGDDFNFIKSDFIVENGIFCKIKQDGKSFAKSEFDDVFDCTDHVVTPGFVNSHIHLNQLLNRAMLDGKGQDELIQSMHSRHGLKSDDDRYWASLLSIYEGLQSGTTFFWAFGSDTSKIVKAMDDAKIRGAFTFAKKDSWFGNEHDVDLSKTEHVIKRLEDTINNWEHKLVDPVIGIASERAASEELLTQVVKLAHDNKLKFNMHIAEGEKPVQDVIKAKGCRSVEYISKFNLLNRKLTLIHATKLDKKEIALCAKKNVSLCHCPISNSRTGVGLMDLKEMFSSGINVCLGTDAASTGNTNNILLEAYCTILLHNSRYNSANFLNEKDVFKMITTNGAKALGLENKIGKIEKGFYADFVLWPIDQPLFQPFSKENILKLIIYSGGQIKPSYVFVNGDLIYHKVPKKYNMKTCIRKLKEYLK
jgi:5-methylthioadenosine/S-adenosylhomocysteine deaminase